MLIDNEQHRHMILFSLLVCPNVSFCTTLKMTYYLTTGIHVGTRSQRPIGGGRHRTERRAGQPKGLFSRPGGAAFTRAD